jgi:hypothetical protein
VIDPNSQETDQSQPTQQPSVSSGIIILCALMTAWYAFAFLGIGFVLFSFFRPVFQWIFGLVWFLVWLWYYPRLTAYIAYIGTVTAECGRRLSDRVDATYNTALHEQWGKWQRERTLIFGTNWPITWIWLVFLYLAVMIGETFRKVWKI